MTNFHLIVTLLFLASNGTELCSCATLGNWRKETPKEYKSVDDVFIGDVTSISESTFEYQIEVCQVFKGNLREGQTIKGVNLQYCSPVVDKLGDWVFFGNYSSYFKINDCGLSSNINEPSGMFPPPLPPRALSEKPKIDEKEILKQWKIESKKSIQEQIGFLRKLSKPQQSKN